MKLAVTSRRRNRRRQSFREPNAPVQKISPAGPLGIGLVKTLLPQGVLQAAESFSSENVMASTRPAESRPRTSRRSRQLRRKFILLYFPKAV